MIAIPKLPISVGEVIKESKSFGEQRTSPIHVEIIVDATAPADLIDGVREAFVPQTPAGKLKVELMADGISATSGAPEISSDVILILVGENQGANATIHRALSQAREDVSTVVMATAATDPEVLIAAFEDVDPKRIAVGVDGADALQMLAEMLSTSSNVRRIALAANFPVFRGPVAMDLIQAAALQNAVVGAIPIIPGADMPVLTITQVRMVLQMATAYNRPADAGRLVEAAIVVGAAFGFRAAAHTLANVLPIFPWITRGVTAYAGTFGLGMAAHIYYEHGIDIYAMVQEQIGLLRGEPVVGEQSPAQLAAGSVS